MGWLVFLLAIALGGLLLWQNLQGITLIFFGGVMTMTLPIAVWVLLFILAGIVSSLTLQFLYRFGRPLARPADSPRPSRPSPNPVAPRQPYAMNEDARSNVPPTVSRPTTDWERDPNDDWNNLSPPPEEVTRIQDFERREAIDRPVTPPEPVDPEPPSSSPSPARAARIYSYSYRTAKETKGEKADTVYDANYRIITPPADANANEPAKNDDEEDWI
jgi:hypothetical protein